MVMAFILWPLALFEIVTADNMSYFLFGSKWEGTGTFLAIFAVFGLFYPIQSVCINVLLANGKSKEYMYLSIIRQSMRMGSLLIFLNQGVKIMTLAFVFSGTLGSIIIIIYGFMEVGIYNVKFLPLLQLFVPLVCSLCMVVFLNVLLSGVISVNTIFVLQLFLMATVYIGMSILLKVDALYEIRQIVLKEFPGLKLSVK